MMAHSRRSRPHDFENSKELSHLEKKILKYLYDHHQSENAKTLDIAKGVGMKTKSDVNPSLYSLEKKKFVKKVTQSPPTWELLNGERFHHPPGRVGGSIRLESVGSSSSEMVPSFFVTNESMTGQFPVQQPIPETHAATSSFLPLPRISPPASQTRKKVSGTEIPPTPAELLNDPSSIFSRLSLRGQLSSEHIEKRIMTLLKEDHRIPVENIVERMTLLNNNDEVEGINKVRGSYVDAINTALENLLKEQKITKVGQLLSLSPQNSSNFGSETKPMKTYFETENIESGQKAFIPDNLNNKGTDGPIVNIPEFAIHPAPVHNVLIPEGKNAISVINEFAQSRKLLLDYEEYISGPDHKRTFYMIAKIDGRKFRGADASTKKEAKLKAAEAALAQLQGGRDLQSCSAAANLPVYQVAPQNATIHDKVSFLVIQKYNKLVAQLPDQITGRKIIAGFVISKPLKSGEKAMEVISIGSGNRCVAGDKLSMVGETVNDCHAEVIARRGLVRYLYRQICNIENAPSGDGIFEAVNNRFKLKEGVGFHLYISTAPCGDSAIFAPSDAATDAPIQGGQDCSHHPVFENKKQGLLRTKVENGEGCIPIDNETAAPTWDGILRGERLRTMSCSDKIAKWNFLGLQGSLLTHFMDPIYMSSLTLGMLYNHGHLTRAVCCRVERFMENLENIDILPQYRVHHPVVSRCSQNQSRETGKLKTREFSLNWSLGDNGPEVLDGTSGKGEEKFGSINHSRLCKSELYKEFKNACATRRKASENSYYGNKMSAGSYQQAKKVFWEAFEKNGFGQWMCKPKEEKDF